MSLNRDPEMKAREDKLFAYMAGWRKGANGGYVSSEGMANLDLKAGHDAGRAASQEAYAQACKLYGAELSPLRTP